MPAARPGEVVLVFFHHIGADDRTIVRVSDSGKVDKPEEREAFVSGRQRLEVIDPKASHEAGRARALLTGRNVIIALEADPRFVQKVAAKSMGPAQRHVLSPEVDGVSKAGKGGVGERCVLDAGLAEDVVAKELVLRANA